MNLLRYRTLCGCSLCLFAVFSFEKPAAAEMAEFLCMFNPVGGGDLTRLLSITTGKLHTQMCCRGVTELVADATCRRSQPRGLELEKY